MYFQKAENRMPGRIFLWIEDHKEKASYIFWMNLMKQLCPYVVVESKKNNSELVKAVGAIKDPNSKYVVVFDSAFDNLQVLLEKKRLKQYADQKPNVVLLDIICFEYLLLEFQDLIKWIYAPDDAFLKSRAMAIKARDKLLNSIESGEMDYKGIQEIAEYDKHLGEHNIEQLAAKILFDLTRNTGFEVSKSVIGECWVNSCCEWKGRRQDDICGLDFVRPTLFEKMKRVYEGTCLKEQFHAAGLEVAL